MKAMGCLEVEIMVALGSVWMWTNTDMRARCSSALGMCLVMGMKTPSQVEMDDVDCFCGWEQEDRCEKNE